MKPYGCRNSERKPGYFVLVRDYRPDGEFTMKQQYIEDRSTTRCNYDSRHNDAQCEGCTK
jgi:hypothetical protein